VVDLDRLERVLVGAAREGRPVTYGQLLAYFGRRVTRITVGALCRDLARVERRREGQGWPDLACLVVRRSDGLPGEGYFASLRAEGAYDGPAEGPAAEAVIRERQARAHAWAGSLPEGGRLESAGEVERAEEPAPGTPPPLSPPRSRPRPRAPCRPS
jgi:hypothetical protein